MAYYDPTTSEGEEQHYLALASEIVGRLAPAPDPEPVDYAPMRSRAERLVLNWLVQTKGGTLTAKGGIPGATGSKTFATMSPVRQIVREAMSDYYASVSSAPYTLTAASSFSERIV